MKILNRSGPRTEPCGTSHLTTPFVENFHSGKCTVFCLADTTLRGTLLTNSANKLITSGVELYD